MPSRTLIVVCLALVAVAALAVACKDGSPGETAATPTPPVEEPTATAGGGQDIRQEDLAAQAGLRDFINTAGGEVDTARITYLDLTEDAIDDAIVPISSGGEGGDIAVFVFGYQDGALTELLHVNASDSSLVADTQDGALRITEPVYAEGDPLCCPSQLRRTTYLWDGARLSQVSDELVPTEEAG